MVTFFGRQPLISCARLVTSKFEDCPWQFFDGVEDSSPNDLTWGDVAITRVMSSGLRQWQIERLLGRFEKQNASKLLAAIPLTLRLEAVPPALIPMLDSVIQEYLNGIAKEWARGKRGAPPWFLPVWTKWTGQISPYLRMIRHDIRGQAEALRSVRVKVAAADGTGVPPSAPLLRIYEAAVFRGRRGRWPAVR